mmetsp:Transcript_3064/g.4519  ORF Transcript_3064/g.4519 Transcript_3064/m.4519 type:complete len:541 (-) Transcript_3064:825-2447(-)
MYFYLPVLIGSNSTVALGFLLVVILLFPSPSIHSFSMPGGLPVHFFNNAGASQMAPQVLERIMCHLQLEMKEGGYNAAAIVQEEHFGVYQTIGRLINASDPMFEIALVESATVAWTRIFYSMADSILDRALDQSGSSYDYSEARLQKVILVSEAEYAANIVAILKYAREQNQRSRAIQWRVFAIPSTLIKSDRNDQDYTFSTGVVDVEIFEDIVSGRWEVEEWKDLAKGSEIIGEGCDHDGGRRQMVRIKPEDIALVCITHIPTNSGIINPVNEIGKCIEEFNTKAMSETGDTLPSILYIVDACQSIGQISVDVQCMRAHALTATGRKYLRGPRGTGFLFVKSDVVAKLIPSEVDHAAAPLTFQTKGDLSNKEEFEDKYISIDIGYKKGAGRFEYWESNLSTRLGLGVAVSYCVDEIGVEYIEKRIIELSAILCQRLNTICPIEIYHADSIQCGIVTFSVKGMDPTSIKKTMLSPLGDERFELSVVPRTSTPIDSARTDVEDLIRISLSYINTFDEIESFINKLGDLVGMDEDRNSGNLM